MAVVELLLEDQQAVQVLMVMIQDVLHYSYPDLYLKLTFDTCGFSTFFA